MTGAASFTIGEIAQAHGVSLRTLRFYEQRQLLTPTRIGQSRYYSASDKVRLQVILQARRLGFSLAEIARIIESRQASAGEPTDAAGVLSRDQIQAQIAVLVQRRDAAEAAIRELRAALTDGCIADAG